MSDSDNLCLSCLLCCNGTLIGFVQLEREEIPALKDILEIEEDSNGDGVFLQACNNLCDKGCTIYDKRPKQCRSFNCKLLKSVEENEIHFDSAVDVINVVKQKKIKIEKQIILLSIKLKSPSFYFKMVELKKVLKKQSPELLANQNHQTLITDLKELESILPTIFGISPF
ncbi:MAG: YkgJ family cysteine cluster protein [Vicingaceae bacterium]|nr:YkgJ family cysteine cluster protein [Vicingaceae bacterium]